MKECTECRETQRKVPLVAPGGEGWVSIQEKSPRD